MTLYAWGKPRTFPALPPAQPRFFDVAPGTRVLAHCHWQPRPWEHPTLIALHGLESSSDAHYVRGLADKAFAAGFNAVRLNQRNCGATEHLSDSLYHSGLTGDPIAVMRELVEVDGLQGVCDRRLLARRKSHAEAGRRFRRQPAEGAVRRLRRLTDDGSGRVRGCARRKAERHLPVALRQKPEAPHAPQGGGVARQVEARCAAAHQIDPRVRRRVHRAVSRLSGRGRLLPARERDARHRQDQHSDADHHRRRRSVRAARPVQRSRGRAKPQHHAEAHAARRPLRVRRGAARGLRRLLGGAGDRALPDFALSRRSRQ